VDFKARPDPGFAPVTARSQQARFVLALLLAGFVLHFFRLDQPAAVVFDEVHFGSFANAYCCSGEYFFDVHPPHGKLPAALALKLGGYEGGQSFETLGTALTAVDPWLLRLVPAIAGSLIPVLIFIILTQLGASGWAAFLGGWAALFDNALLVQTHVLALEGPLILSILAAISLALAAVRQANPLRQSLLCFGAGLCVGGAVGTKFTGLTSALLVAVILLAPLCQGAGMKHSIRMGVCALLGAVIVYLGGWVLHFTLLDQPGPGDAWGTPSGNLVQDIIGIHRTMFHANYGLTATHPNTSAWWSWPWMWRPLYYYSGDNTAIYFVGNPVVWWGTSVGLLVLLWKTTRGVLGGSSAQLTPERLLPLLGFAVSYLPYLMIPRVMFLYHYLPSLMFAICAVAVWLDPMGWMRPGRFRDQPRVVSWLIILIPIGFVIVSPLTYGFMLPDGVLRLLVRVVH
jgi:dolichyl-phosphate-mannose-protein mannosyltransferase